jgi:flagellar hook-associated protein 2
MDWSTVIQELATAERAPETQWEATQATLNSQNAAFGTISTYLTELQTDVTNLQNPDLYGATTVSTSNSSVATATTSTGAVPGTYSFDITQLATATQVAGPSSISDKLVPNGVPADVTVATAGFSTPVTTGTFTVDGAQVTIGATDSLQQVFNNIATATNNKVTASYNSTTDGITLSSSSAITLGSAADSSNFLQVSELYSNGTGTVSSTGALGRANLTNSLDSAQLGTTINDGGSGKGAFTINGVTINFDASTDSLDDVISRINTSGAGVTASYDTLNNRFILTNNTTGNLGISLKDTTGNFLGATGLLGGTATTGKNLLYTVNGGAQQLQSQSNTIDSDSSTIAGLSLSALTTGNVTATVASDTSGVTSALQDFVTNYNSVQSYITAQSATSTDSSGNITPGLLTGDLTSNSIAETLRSSTLSPVSVPGVSSTYSEIDNFGITSNGQNNTISLDSTALTAALTSNLTQVQNFFTNKAAGWGAALTNNLTATNGSSGTLEGHESSLTSQVQSINTQISSLETKITNDTANWTTEFSNMEAAESQTNQELTYLSQSVTSGSL